MPITVHSEISNETAKEFAVGWIKRHSKWKALHSKIVKSTKYGRARGSELASYEQGSIVLKDKFFDLLQQNDEQLADHLYAHELGHGVESTLGKKWMDKAAELGIDVWDTNNLPLGQFNMDEAFAETAAVVIMNDSHGMSLLKNKWPSWLDLVDGALSGKTTASSVVHTVAALVKAGHEDLADKLIKAAIS